VKGEGEGEGAKVGVVAYRPASHTSATDKRFFFSFVLLDPSQWNQSDKH